MALGSVLLGSLLLPWLYVAGLFIRLFRDDLLLQPLPPSLTFPPQWAAAALHWGHVCHEPGVRAGAVHTSSMKQSPAGFLSYPHTL